jgi:hypothetical protein
MKSFNLDRSLKAPKKLHNLQTTHKSPFKKTTLHCAFSTFLILIQVILSLDIWTWNDRNIFVDFLIQQKKYIQDSKFLSFYQNKLIPMDGECTRKKHKEYLNILWTYFWSECRIERKFNPNHVPRYRKIR